MKKLFIITTTIPAQTRKLGANLGKILSAGMILALEGNLGSGKTVFVQGIAQGLGITPRVVRSPTFALIQEYAGNIPLCHVDLYRLNANEIRALGLEEYWQNLNHVIAIEWADKALEFLPEQTLYIQFDVLKGNQRRITFLGHSHWKKILKSLKKF